MSERMIEVTDGVELCVDTQGDPADPPLLLLAGLGCSMLWWEEGFVSKLVDGGRFVIRYDQRDTGLSTTWPHGEPTYSNADLFTDALEVLDGCDVEAAHIFGLSAGGGLAQTIALAVPERVRSLSVISTSPATPGDHDLPGPTEAFGRFFETASVDWGDRESIIDYLVGYEQVIAGDARPFDEVARREFVARDAERASDFAAIQNHDVVVESEDIEVPALSTLNVPTLVLHGTADAMLPVEHGEALAAEIPGAELVRLEGAGHGLLRPEWDRVAQAVLNHTA